ncbi:MAG: DUF134 domain-containing protein [Candidatus Heimdallarchaeaceae archaeon]
MSDDSSNEGKKGKEKEKSNFDNQFFSPRRSIGGGPRRGMRRGGMHGQRGMGRKHFRRGRPPVAYSIPINRRINQAHNILVISSFELEILKMADVEELTQKEIAEKLGISQTSVWRYLKGLRKRIADSIINHNLLEIEVVE